MGRLATLALLALGISILALAPGPGWAVRSSRPVWGFLPTWDPNALTSFRHHASQLTVVLPTGLTLTGSGTLVAGHLPRDLVHLAHSRGVRVMPVLSNYRNGWRSATADRVLRSPALRARLAGRIADLARRGGWDGVNVDLESLRARDRAALPRLLGDLSRAMGPASDVSVDVPAAPAPAFDLRALGASADHAVVMAYDRHVGAGAPGPIAPPGFVGAARRRARRLVPARKLVLGLPSYAYAWKGARPPVPLSVDAALQVARQEGVLPRWSRAWGAPWFSVGRHGERQVVWLADAAAFAGDLRAAGPGGPVAIWRLGAEDPGIWPQLGRTGLTDASLSGHLATIPPPERVRVSGSGDVIQAVPGSPGWRSVGADGTSEHYMLLPQPWQVRRTSGGGKRLAITFDDGPSSTYTPQILAELARLHVPATFFVIGQNAAAHPGLVQQEVNSGYTVGNHTFTHPNLATTPSWRTRLEVTATSRVLTGITGRRPVLFRAPYAADASPSGQGEVRPLILVQDLGETVVGASIDSQDYLRPGTRRIVVNVLHSLHSGNIILFHDGGGDRSQTVAALPLVVSALRARGYTLVSVPQLMGVSPAAAMPAVHGVQLWLSLSVAWAAESWYFGMLWISRIGIALLTIIAARAVLLAALAIRHRRRAAPPPAGPLPSVTVLVPAYNEATVIGRTLDSLQTQRGVHAEIFVIDDGSSDGTAGTAERPGVRVVRQANAGKWAALNRGLMLAQGEVVVAIDADTLLDRDAVVRLARWFTDPGIGAVSGTAKVGNRHTLVTMWQHVEYTTGFNLDRRAYSDLNAITVVPGAIGGWRRSALIDLGGYSGRTLAEDCDLTIALRRAGWRIVYEPTAVAWTEAPETLRALARQRLRWTFGTFQVLWLNRGALFRRREGALGSLALPYAWLYQVGISALGPAIDLLVLLALLTGGWTLALWWFGIASAAEMGVAWLAFRLEGEPAWPVLTMPLQRVAYRQLMYVTVMRSLARALIGKRLGWGKLARTGSVKAG